MRKTCDHVCHTDDDLLYDVGELCGEPADYKCSAFNGRVVYRCTYHTIGIFSRYERLDVNDRDE